MHIRSLWTSGRIVHRHTRSVETAAVLCGGSRPCRPYGLLSRDSRVCPFSRHQEKGHTPTVSATLLLVRDGRAGGLKGLARLVRGFLVDLLENGLRSSLDQILGLLQAKTGERTHLFDHLDLLLAR